MTFVNRFAEDAAQTHVAELILGELLANAVEHAPGLVEMEIDWRGAKPIVSMHDAGPGLRGTTGVLPPNILDEGGRGLFLVHRLAEDVKIDASSGVGTEIRAVLPVVRALG